MTDDQEKKSALKSASIPEGVQGAGAARTALVPDQEKRLAEIRKRSDTYDADQKICGYPDDSWQVDRRFLLSQLDQARADKAEAHAAVQEACEMGKELVRRLDQRDARIAELEAEAERLRTDNRRMAGYRLDHEQTALVERAEKAEAEVERLTRATTEMIERMWRDGHEKLRKRAESHATTALHERKLRDQAVAKGERWKDLLASVLDLIEYDPNGLVNEIEKELSQ